LGNKEEGNVIEKKTPPAFFSRPIPGGRALYPPLEGNFSSFLDPILWKRQGRAVINKEDPLNS